MPQEKPNGLISLSHLSSNVLCTLVWWRKRDTAAASELASDFRLNLANDLFPVTLSCLICTQKKTQSTDVLYLKCDYSLGVKWATVYAVGFHIIERLSKCNNWSEIWCARLHSSTRTQMAMWQRDLCLLLQSLAFYLIDDFKTALVTSLLCIFWTFSNKYFECIICISRKLRVS